MKKTNMKMDMKNTIALLSLALGLGSCGNPGSSGELTGVPGRQPWYHPQPYGTVYVPTGTFHMGHVEEDITSSMINRPKQVSIHAFFMDDTEITNNEYRQFVYWVRDSMAAKTIGDPYTYTDDITGDELIDWDEASQLDYTDPEITDQLDKMMYSKADRVGSQKSIDTRKLVYNYKTYDLQEAAKMQYKME
ncbi:MAG: SUMF1/EgtB/PvdO family nonheme iron enzyme, partial [Bacteroidota bacterium]|nr:SUMF1/EgtB/PvdO family nonheme iron enzyme [Bacteroidota bacterium]